MEWVVGGVGGLLGGVGGVLGGVGWVVGDVGWVVFTRITRLTSIVSQPIKIRMRLLTWTLPLSIHAIFL